MSNVDNATYMDSTLSTNRYLNSDLHTESAFWTCLIKQYRFGRHICRVYGAEVLMLLYSSETWPTHMLHKRRLNTFTCDASERYWAFVGMTKSQTRIFSLKHATNTNSSEFYVFDEFGGL